ncbi:MAG: hypothetical protein ACQEQ8_09225 [Pseudomonadota bacterium]
MSDWTIFLILLLGASFAEMRYRRKHNIVLPLPVFDHFGVHFKTFLKRAVGVSAGLFLISAFKQAPFHFIDSLQAGWINPVIEGIFAAAIMLVMDVGWYAFVFAKPEPQANE